MGEKTVRYKMKIDLNNWSTRLLCLFFATDLVFICIHLIHIYTSFAPSYLFSIEEERSYADIYQYIKEYWIVIGLGFVLLKRYSTLYLGWFLLFVYVLLDDTVQIHEKVGKMISDHLNFVPMFDLRAVDFGELLVTACAGLFFLIFIGTAYRFGDRFSRGISRSLIRMILVLALFGIFFDMVHVAIGSPTFKPILGLLEDGGEQVVMSVIAWFVLFLPERLQLANFSDSKKVREEALTINH
ncbi:MAG: hypothetical protein WBG73_12815 [Coleofasciculaceae cyanobacterium]